MARMVKGIFFSGSMSNITFYEMDGIRYARKKSSLTRKRVLKDKKFEKTRQYASNFALASATASPVYRALPFTAQGRLLFRILTGEAASLLYEGKDQQKVHDILWKRYITDTNAENIDIITKGNKKAPEYKQLNRQLRKLFISRLKEEGKPITGFKRAWKHGEPFKPWLYQKE
jgi:hypothetical protein